jgi:hypothetical protein
MSTLNVATIKSGSANTPPTIRDASDVEVGTFCRAWVNFNGTGVVATRATFNVSSISDNGTGNYTVNFTNPLTNTNYAAVASSRTTTTGTGNQYATGLADFAIGSIRVSTTADGTTSSALADAATVSVAVFR